METTQSKPLTVVSVKEWAKANGFVQMNPTIKTNEKGYPFVTFINKENKAENVYFSKKASVGLKSGDDAIALVKSHNIAHTLNAAGEKRTKLVGTGERVDLDGLFS